MGDFFCIHSRQFICVFHSSQCGGVEVWMFGVGRKEDNSHELFSDGERRHEKHFSTGVEPEVVGETEVEEGGDGGRKKNNIK